MYANQRLSSPIVTNMLIANCIIWLAMQLLPIGDQIIEYCSLFNAESPFFRPFQVFTYMFLHADFLHLLFNMYALWMFGRILEYEIGSQRFFIYYMVCGIGAALLQLGVGYYEYWHIGPVETIYQAKEMEALLCTPTIGASGAAGALRAEIAAEISSITGAAGAG